MTVRNENKQNKQYVVIAHNARNKLVYTSELFGQKRKAKALAKETAQDLAGCIITVQKMITITTVNLSEVWRSK